MLAVTRAGAVVLPASPSFYSKPATLDALLDTVVGRVLDQLGLAQQADAPLGRDGAKEKRRRPTVERARDRRLPRRAWPRAARDGARRRWTCSRCGRQARARPRDAALDIGRGFFVARARRPPTARRRSWRASRLASCGRERRGERLRSAPEPTDRRPARDAARPAGRHAGARRASRSASTRSRCFALCRLALPARARTCSPTSTRWGRAWRRWRSASAPTSCSRRSSPSARCAWAPTPTTRR